MYPKRVWEMGSVIIERSGKERQLWWSREPTAEDHIRRREAEQAYLERKRACTDRV